MGKCKLADIAGKIADLNSLKVISFKGAGAFKETFLADSGLYGQVALKIMHPHNCSLARTDREIKAMKMCNSKYIGKLIDHGQETIAGTTYLYSIEEYFNGGTLSEKIRTKPLEMTEAKCIGKCLALAIEHMWKFSLVHRDIKPDNIMFRKANNEPAFVDFGLVRNISKSSLTKDWIPQGPCTPLYAAPEQLNNEKHLIDWRTDQFGLAITICFCLTGKHPFQQKGMSIAEAVSSVGNHETCSQDFIDFTDKHDLKFMQKMLEPWPVRRHSKIITFSDLFESGG